MNKNELIGYLRTLDEILILELLEITSDDLLDAFMDKVEENLDKIYRQVE